MRRVSNPLDLLLGYQMRRASNAMMAQLAVQLGALGLRTTEASILVLVDANPLITQASVGRILGIQRPNMGPLMAALTARGVISRQPIDGKSYGFATTEAGALLAQQALQAMATHERAFFAGLAEGERRGLLKLLSDVAGVRPDAAD